MKANVSALSLSCCVRVKPMPWPTSKSTRSGKFAGGRRGLQACRQLGGMERRDERTGKAGGQQHGWMGTLSVTAW